MTHFQMNNLLKFFFCSVSLLSSVASFARAPRCLDFFNFDAAVVAPSSLDIDDDEDFWRQLDAEYGISSSPYDERNRKLLERERERLQSASQQMLLLITNRLQRQGVRFTTIQVPIPYYSATFLGVEVSTQGDHPFNRYAADLNTQERTRIIFVPVYYLLFSAKAMFHTNSQAHSLLAPLELARQFDPDFPVLVHELEHMMTEKERQDGDVSVKHIYVSTPPGFSLPRILPAHTHSSRSQRRLTSTKIFGESASADEFFAHEKGLISQIDQGLKHGARLYDFLAIRHNCLLGLRYADFFEMLSNASLLQQNQDALLTGIQKASTSPRGVTGLQFNFFYKAFEGAEPLTSREKLIVEMPLKFKGSTLSQRLEEVLLQFRRLGILTQYFRERFTAWYQAADECEANFRATGNQSAATQCLQALKERITLRPAHHR